MNVKSDSVSKCIGKVSVHTQVGEINIRDQGVGLKNQSVAGTRALYSKFVRFRSILEISYRTQLFFLPPRNFVITLAILA